MPPLRSAFFFSLLITLGGCSENYVHGALALDQKAPRPAGCELEVLRNQDDTSLDLKFDLIGTFNINDSLTPKAEATAKAKACEWGGDAVLMNYHKGTIETQYGSQHGTGGTEVQLVMVKVLSKPPAGQPTKVMKQMGISDEKLKKKVSFDTDCPIAQVAIDERMEDLHSGNYRVTACGESLKYIREGAIYKASE